MQLCSHSAGHSAVYEHHCLLPVQHPETVKAIGLINAGQAPMAIPVKDQAMCMST
jgi:hypothetical protein